MITDITKGIHTAAAAGSELAQLAAMLERIKDVRSETAGKPDWLRHLEGAHEHLRRAVADVSRNAVT